MTRVEFVLKSLDEYNIITIPQEASCLFPGADGRFAIKSDTGDDDLVVRIHPPSKHLHMHLSTTKWFKQHRSELKDGDSLVIEISEYKNKREYYLRKQ